MAEWPLLLLRSILLEGLWAPLVGAAGALGPAARLEVHRVVEGLISDNEEGRAWREQWFAEGIGEKLGVPVVEALVPLLASAEDQAWWTPEAGAAAPPPRCAELVCLLRTAAALAKEGAALSAAAPPPTTTTRARRRRRGAACRDRRCSPRSDGGGGRPGTARWASQASPRAAPRSIR